MAHGRGGDGDGRTGIERRVVHHRDVERSGTGIGRDDDRGGDRGLGRITAGEADRQRLREAASARDDRRNDAGVFSDRVERDGHPDGEDAAVFERLEGGPASGGAALAARQLRNGAGRTGR
jgi:hypothetical protein